MTELVLVPMLADFIPFLQPLTASSGTKPVLSQAKNSKSGFNWFVCAVIGLPVSVYLLSFTVLLPYLVMPLMPDPVEFSGKQLPW